MHRHNYNIINQFETKSEAEQLHEMGLRPKTCSSFQKLYVTDFKCSICGKLKRKIVKS